jgi:hypothetical protein
MSGVVLHVSYQLCEKAQVGRLLLEVSPGKNIRPFLIKAKQGWGVVQVIDYLPSKCEALSSNPSYVKKKKNK